MWLAAEQEGLPLDLSTLDGIERPAGDSQAGVDLLIIDSLSRLSGGVAGFSTCSIASDGRS
jgi:hypothetical protein